MQKITDWAFVFVFVLGYLGTWSAVQHYIKRNGADPLDALLPRLAAVWTDNEEKEVSFPLFVRMGRSSGASSLSS